MTFITYTMRQPLKLFKIGRRKDYLVPTVKFWHKEQEFLTQRCKVAKNLYFPLLLCAFASKDFLVCLD